MNVEKRAIRQILRERRRNLAVAVVEAAGTAVCAQLRAFAPYQAARSVVAYIADENEISAAPLFVDIVRSGRPLYLPQPSTGVTLARWNPGEPLSASRGGVLEPSSGIPAQPKTPAIVLVPVVAWDETGVRLGRGGGFYDRLFAQFSDGIVRVGLAYECLLYPQLPRDPWDVALHFVMTERRIVRCRGEEVARPGLLQKGGLQW